MFLLAIFKLDYMKPAAVGKIDFKLKKRKGSVSKTSVAVPPVAAWCCSAIMLRFRDVELK